MTRMGTAILLVFVLLLVSIWADHAWAQTNVPPATTPFIAIPLSAEPPAAAASPAAPSAPPEAPEDYLIQPEDVLRISVVGEPDLGLDQIVDPKGSINVPMLGSVMAGGLTRTQLADELAKRYSKYLVEPKVQVGLVQFRKPRVYVVGQVNRPSTFELRAGDRVMEAIALAGSFTQNADLSAATLTHQGSEERVPLDLHRLFFQGDMAENLTLQDGDTIYIPEDVTNRFFVLGEVMRPGKYEYKEGMTVMDAISDAGGANPKANAKSTFVIRGDPKNPQRIKVDVSRFLKHADIRQNVVLQPGDVIYIPETNKPDWSKIASIIGIVVNSSYIARIWGL